MSPATPVALWVLILLAYYPDIVSIATTYQIIILCSCIERSDEMPRFHVMPPPVNPVTLDGISKHSVCIL